MQAINEIIDYDSSRLALKIFKPDEHELGDWHYHKEVEILIVIKGQIDLFIENEKYSLNSGDVLLIGSMQMHYDRIEKGQALDYLVLQFDIQPYFEATTLHYLPYFLEKKRPLSDLNYLFAENDLVREAVSRSILTIHDEITNKQIGYEMVVNTQIKTILTTLLRADTRGILEDQHNPDLLRLKPVLDYVDQHLNERITVEECSKLINVSYYHFVKLFKKVMDTSFVSYITYQRIKKAERLLLTENYEIHEVAELVGMPNMGYFYKMFKHYSGISPGQFKARKFT